jgi:hypothetical protein
MEIKQLQSFVVENVLPGLLKEIDSLKNSLDLLLLSVSRHF